MLIKLFETVICLCMCFSVITPYFDVKPISERTPKKHVLPKMVQSDFSDSYYKQSRYTKFDKVMTRINKMDVEIPDDGPSKIRHKNWNSRKAISTTTTKPTTTTEIDLFAETYGEISDDEYFDDYENTLDDEDDELEYEDEDENLFDEIQAEEPTEKQPSSTSQPRTVSKLTEYKWTHFGTRAKVEESMRNQLHANPSKEQINVNAVMEHYTRVNQQSMCKRPLLRVIPVQLEHPDPTRSYIPPCTILYRCADDSGCCKRDTKCQYKTRQLVSLYFYAKVIGREHSTIERLEFYNHTECACKERTEQVQPESGKGAETKYPERFFFNRTTEKNLIGHKCNCPTPYQATSISPKCVCDCDKFEEDCIQLKKGKEHFSMMNRICIQDGECGIPTCEYGTYTVEEGKCPTKQDKLEDFRKMRINM
ncbi:unnamed protein product [Phyllotreta striolata]|uniref:Platelet-derived growth factor (PDGF) family profile domain-containing protein n=1 Tax=Phyllotreta striolata TaxID=444603 RepID=A0A9N9TRA3_PHYSR|nr:unnamed protein product [Phyllotreta striolata]